MLASAWSIRPPSAPRISDALLAEAQRRADRQFGVGLVLVRSRPFERDAGRLERGQCVLADRVAVADPQVDRDSERRCVAGAAVGRDDDLDPVVPAGPGEVEVGAGRDVTVGEDERDHAGDATPRAPRAGRSGARSVPDPMLDSGRARRPRSSRDPARPRCRSPQGRDARGHPVRRITHTAAEAAAALGVELGQIVKSLVFVIPAAAGGEPVLCLVAGHNRVDLARLAAITSAPDIRRATAREAHDLTGFSIGGIPPIGTERAVRVIMDPDLGRYQVVWAAAGLPTAVFGVPPGTLRILSNAMVAPIAEEPTADLDVEPTVAAGQRAGG